MKLVEALTILRGAQKSGAPPLPVMLACGFTPLHLQNLLAAHLQLRAPDRRVAIEVGLFGDLEGSVARLDKAVLEGAAVVVEWADVDPRLGVRSLGGWRPSDLPDIVRSARARLGRLGDAIARAAGRFPIAVALPSLPLPPLAFAARWQASAVEIALREAVLAFAARLAELPLVRLVSPGDLDRRSPPAARFDVRLELDAGHPYTLDHADALGEALARLVRPPPPKKGLITDLDGTLWKGIVGEDGEGGVRFDLEGHAQIHGLYQQVLRSLADSGVLLAVASKNDPEVVRRALARADLILPATSLFPIEASWGPKSEAVARVLAAWNVGADSVVFVDDSPMELAEVKAAHPAIECLAFPEGEAAAYELLGRLRELFGRESVGAEDALRLASLRSAAEAEGARAAAPDRFLDDAEAEIRLDYAKDPADTRAFELVNKTNQWNLNGRRVTEAEWRTRLDDPETFLQVASYTDKFGPLGKIAVIRGRRGADREVHVDAWVMSCRAFARRIEHACLEHLFTRFDADAIVFDFAVTERNGPLRELFEALLGAPPEGPGLRLPRERFRAACPRLSHSVREVP